MAISRKKSKTQSTSKSKTTSQKREPKKLTKNTGKKVRGGLDQDSIFNGGMGDLS